jgi:hypothetical protein
LPAADKPLAFSTISSMTVMFASGSKGGGSAAHLSGCLAVVIRGRVQASDPPHLLRHPIPVGGARQLIVPAAVARAILHQLVSAVPVVSKHRPGDLGDIIVSHVTNLHLNRPTPRR